MLFTSVPQIEKDLLRTMPTNACFSSLTSVGVPRLRRILRGLAWLYPDIGYCQGTGMVRTYANTTNNYMTSASRIYTHKCAHTCSTFHCFFLHCLFPTPVSSFPSGGFLSAALSWGGGCAMDDVRPDWRPPSSFVLFLHSAGCPNRPEGSPSAHCSVPASSWPITAGAWHR